MSFRRPIGNGEILPTQRPAPGAIVVRQKGTRAGEYSSLVRAAEALERLDGPQHIFIYPGTYEGHVKLHYNDPLSIQGYTDDPSSYARNQVTVHVAISAASVGGENSRSSGIWVKSKRFEMRNVNVINSFGTGTDTVAVALTADGERHVYKACGFSSYQDTLYIRAHSAYFSGCFVGGAVDFIFGGGSAWFSSATIGVKPPAYQAIITAQKAKEDSRSMFVFDHSRVHGLPGTKPGSTYLGRPWSEFAAVVFQYCYLSDIINSDGWMVWKTSDPRTQHVRFEEYANYGPGTSSKRVIGGFRSRPVRIEDVLGADYTLWVH